MEEKLAPPGSVRRIIAQRLLRGLVPYLRRSPPYARWAEAMDEESRRAVRLDLVAEAPLLSIVVPCFRTPEKLMKLMVDSVLDQVYERWELILVEASSPSEPGGRISGYADLDPRIKVVAVPNEGISSNTNAGVREATGEYVAFLDHDDALADTALYEVALAVTRDPQLDVLYSDEDKIDHRHGYRSRPHFKPDWSPDLVTHVNYVSHLLVVRRSTLDGLGGFNPDTDGAQDHDLVLRLSSAGAKIGHIPKVLYHWRTARGSTSLDAGSKPEAAVAGLRALRKHLARRGHPADVSIQPGSPGWYRVRYRPPGEGVSLIVRSPWTGPTEHMDLLRRILRPEPSDGSPREFLLPEVQGGPSPEGLPSGEVVLVPDSDEDFFLAAARRARYPILLFVGADVAPSGPWMAELEAVAALDHVGAVAPLVVDKMSRIVDCGLVRDRGILSPLFQRLRKGKATAFGNTGWTRNVDALTGRVFAMRRPVLDSVADQARAGSFTFSPALFEALRTDHRLYNVVWTHVEFVEAGLAPREHDGGSFNPNLACVAGEPALPPPPPIREPETAHDE